MLLGIFHTDEDGDYLDPCLYCREELVDGFQLESDLAALERIEGLADEELERLAHLRVFPESYAFELSPWNEILGYEIDARNSMRPLARKRKSENSRRKSRGNTMFPWRKFLQNLTSPSRRRKRSRRPTVNFAGKC